MSQGRAIIAELFAVLDEEREAIRKLDGATVSETALRKSRLAEQLAALSMSELEDQREELASLRHALRRNGTLLAHARSCLRDVLELAAAASGTRLNQPHLRARL